MSEKLGSNLPGKRSRDDDIEPFDVETARHRMFVALLNGVPPSFGEVIADLGLDTDPAQLIRAVFSAYEAAAVLDACIADFRPKGMATVLTVVEYVERSLAAARGAVAAESRAEISMSRIEDFTRRYGDLEDDPAASDLRETVARLERRKDLFDKARAALDGRGAARSRMRLFAEELAPHFFALCPRTLRGAPAFKRYLRAAIELMTGSCPEGRLIRTVPRDIAERRKIIAN